MTITPLYWKLIGGGIAAAGLGILVASWMARGAEIEHQREWRSTVIEAVTTATVPPGKDGKRGLVKSSEVPSAIAALKASKDSAEATLAGIDRAALADKALQAKLDKQLSAILDNQDAVAEGTKARITDLLTRQATGDREKDCAIMDSDSNAAWDGWRN